MKKSQPEGDVRVNSESVVIVIRCTKGRARDANEKTRRSLKRRVTSERMGVTSILYVVANEISVAV